LSFVVVPAIPCPRKILFFADRLTRKRLACKYYVCRARTGVEASVAAAKRVLSTLMRQSRSLES
jgi:hypothetical protein